jgi:hypothetical protein
MNVSGSATRSVSLAAVLALVACASGCGLGDPYDATQTQTAGETAPRVVDNELQPARPYRDAPPNSEPAPSARIAIERFARLYINWTYRSLASHRRQLAAMAVGEAAATQRRAAAETGRDYELRAGKVANHGEIVALAEARDGSDRWVLVTRETTTGEDVYAALPPEYHVTIATAVELQNGWAVSRWEPQR